MRFRPSAPAFGRKYASVMSQNSKNGLGKNSAAHRNANNRDIMKANFLLPCNAYTGGKKLKLHFARKRSLSTLSLLREELRVRLLVIMINCDRS